ncbi:hypothetical protein OnM2_004024 [Erysiphe neolycopersici]|uniref:Uncharacterized protein n=1 Tax=Erysiphe neolycopersici TaxID=212602 RepID=A0A420I7Q8_9PEZI|nr:hypothetical protein OnM2_004024 [Erysiphe neolycopersici]
MSSPLLTALFEPPIAITDVKPGSDLVNGQRSMIKAIYLYQSSLGLQFSTILLGLQSINRSDSNSRNSTNSSYSSPASFVHPIASTTFVSDIISSNPESRPILSILVSI